MAGRTANVRDFPFIRALRIVFADNPKIACAFCALGADDFPYLSGHAGAGAKAGRPVVDGSAELDHPYVLFAGSLADFENSRTFAATLATLTSTCLGIAFVAHAITPSQIECALSKILTSD